VAPELRLPSFAKINWFLKIEGRRQDGYHELTTVFQTIDLADEISFQLVAAPPIEIRVSGFAVPAGPDNLIWRAASLLRERAGSSPGLRITVLKRIPPGGGLGGGSSNAAVTLLAANQLWSVGLPPAELIELAQDLGADVPFFLQGGAALGTGRGDKIHPLPGCRLDQDLLLLFPGFSVPTREAYGARDWGPVKQPPVLTSRAVDNTIQRFCEAMSRVPPDLSWLRNDFEQVVFNRYPALQTARRQLLAAGCERVLLCGSGSTLMGIVPPAVSGEAAEEVSRRTEGQVFLCRSITREDYQRTFVEAGLNLTLS
jgi:4-diphosphocytidyl-2-C-methyl-D-erythritol kinase